MNLWWTAGFAFVITIVFLSGMTPVARHIGLVDHPGGRKQHRGKIPLIGGVGIAIGMTIGLLLLDASLSTFRAYLAGVLLLIVIGVLDDFNELTPRLRLVAQLCAGLLLSCWGGLEMNQIGNFLGIKHFALGLWALPVTVIAVVALINAVNMLDGMNGLAASTSVVSLISFLVIYSSFGVYESHAVLAVIIAAMCGFLVFNYPVFRYRRRLVFLGDAGSTVLGFTLAWFGIKLTTMPAMAFSPLLLLWFFLVPVFDLLAVTLRRVVIKRVSPFAADREHMHHFLKSLGIRESFVTFLVLCFNLIGNTIGLSFYFHKANNNVIFGSFVLLFAAYFLLSQWFWSRQLTLSK
jgi:UDP-GlcNAc:undecaprenyl-phosphate/decaprenyl-phosphate GlcNAc-1-phosphate transferase